MLFNIAFVIGGSPDAGWTSYFPMAGTEFTSGVGNNYYAIALQISGLGTLMTGINFLVTILKMRTPGMTLMRMPMFTWSILITTIIIIFAFPVLTVALALMTFDRLFDAHFFTMAAAVCQCYGPTCSGYGVTLKYISLFYRHSVFSLKSLVHSHVNVYSVTVQWYTQWLQFLY